MADMTLTEIRDALREHGVRCNTVGSGKTRRVESLYCTKAGTLVAVNFVNFAGSGVSVRVSGIARLMDSVFRSEMLRTLNQANREYKFVRFTLDKDDEVICGCDIPVTTRGVGEAAAELFIHTVNIIDRVIRDILSIAISGADSDDDEE